MDYARAAAAVQDPGTPPVLLGEIAAAHPTLRVAVAAHPAAYPELLAWLAGLGDPLVASALATRARVRAAPAAPEPHRRRRGLLVGLAVAVVLVVGGGVVLLLTTYGLGSGPIVSLGGVPVPESVVTRQVERTLYELASGVSQWRMDNYDGSPGDLTFEGLPIEELMAVVDIPDGMSVEFELAPDGRSLTLVATHELLDQVAELTFPGNTVVWR